MRRPIFQSVATKRSLKSTFAEPWQAVNIQSLNLTGAEASVQVRVSATQQV